MKLVLDTCAILWTILEPEKLSPRARKAIVEKSTEILVSPMSCAEIACLVERKRLQLDRHWKLWFRHFVSQNGWKVVGVDLPIVEESYSLPGEFHPDPVDRIVVATTRLFQATVVTADQKIINYPHVDHLW